MKDFPGCFHPAVRAWFESAFVSPTPAQLDAWRALQAGRHTLVAAPTGSGKTLAAFLAAIDALVREAVESPAGLPDQTRIVYVSPLKALSNDIHRNLELPLAGIGAELERMGLPGAGIRTAVRTGDTPQAQRRRARAPRRGTRVTDRRTRSSPCRCPPIRSPARSSPARRAAPA